MSRAIDELDWEAKDDARTLASAIEIRNDKERYAKAVKAAQIMSAEDAKRSKAMKRVAGQKNAPVDSKEELNDVLRSTIASL